MEGISDAFFRDFFISVLKDEIQAHVLLSHPRTWLEATKWTKESQQVFPSQNRKPSFILHPQTTNHVPPTTPLKI